ncbi:branched-chain amino acid transport system substrate-binding protein [Paraburkholderia sp. WC7.3g]|uniref:ABC transporter substrate-binding protein n=1 Tax=Paraburkholderia podalyriae TaxID=1938811 RepID=A0ABR7PI20_9BURK|nr:ABC transporter substrate-binding protein [Paraburkholderia podalyriae]MBC8745987.1 ABC transporter substrate-binding protein [Paraburkholderia podalyriae]
MKRLSFPCAGISLAGLLLALSSTMSCAQDAMPIRIVGSLDLSGPASDLGEQSLAGIQFAIDSLNKHGGVLGRPVTFDKQDNGTNPQRAINQASALVQPGASLLLSPTSSGSTIAVSKMVSGKLKVPMCVAISAAEEITMKDYQPYVFSMAPTTYMLMRAVTTRLAKQSYKRYALLVPDYAGGRSAATRFKAFLKEMNPQAQIVVEEYPKLGAIDYTASINKILAAKPDYVWAQIYGADLVTFSKQANALGFFKQINNHFMTVVDANTLKILGDDAPLGTEAYQYAPFNYLEKTPHAKDFVSQFKAHTGNYPSDWASVGYDCVMTWAQAVTTAKSTQSDAVMRAIETNAFDLLRGKVRFGQYDHEAEVPVYIGKMVKSAQYGQPVLDIDEVVAASITRPSKAVVEEARK